MKNQNKCGFEPKNIDFCNNKYSDFQIKVRKTPKKHVMADNHWEQFVLGLGYHFWSF